INWLVQTIMDNYISLETRILKQTREQKSHDKEARESSLLQKSTQELENNLKTEFSDTEENHFKDQTKFLDSFEQIPGSIELTKVFVEESEANVESLLPQTGREFASTRSLGRVVLAGIQDKLEVNAISSIADVPTAKFAESESEECALDKWAKRSVGASLSGLNDMTGSKKSLKRIQFMDAGQEEEGEESELEEKVNDKINEPELKDLNNHENEEFEFEDVRGDSGKLVSTESLKRTQIEEAAAILASWESSAPATKRFSILPPLT
ncbi:hypothetical protein HK096_001282, partial [Nowakowskiella sp. JEL0078]